MIGVDPTGQFVEATATDDVDIFTAGIEIEKTAAPTQVERGNPATIDYTYNVTNSGSLELDNVIVTDGDDPLPSPVNATCSPVTYVSGDDGDGRLDVTETWQYTCQSSVTDPQADLINLARVSADPVFPDLTEAPPEVTDSPPLS